jgi:fatty acid desaturase
LLRKSADVRTLVYLAVAVALIVVQWNLKSFHLSLYVWSLFMGITAAVISHNHNHTPIWKNRALNVVTSWVISVLYGHPAIAWVPTHNQTHHKYNNREGDTSRSPKIFKGNHLLSLLVYPTATGIAQMPEIATYLANLRRRSKRLWYAAMSEYVVFFGVLAGAFLLDWRKALVFVLVPQQFSLFMIQVFNYVQHVEADAESDWNHSRNFISSVLNVLLFNNGYHTVHHLKPGLHWSETPALHAEHAAKIHPALQQKSWWGYMLKTFFVRPFTGEAPPLAAVSPVVPVAE